MTRKRRIIKIAALGLLGLIGLMAPPALAVPRYLIKGSPVTASEAVTSKSGTLILTVSELSTTVTCGPVILEGTISIEGKSQITNTYSKCTVKGPACEVATPVVVKAKGELLTHVSEVYEVLTPLEGEAFTTLKFKGATCTLPGEVGLSGTLSGQIEPGESTTRTLYLSPEIEELVCKIVKPCGLTFGANTATATGVSTPKLNGANKGQAWGAAAVPEFVVAGKPLDLVLQEKKLATESIEATGGAAKISVPTYLGFGYIIACKQVLGSGAIEKLGRGSATFNFKECVLTDGAGKVQAGCKVEAVKAETSFLANVPEGSNPFLVFSPPSGEAKDVLIQFTVKGEVCLLLTGERAIRGTTVGLAEKVEAVAQPLVFGKSAGLMYGTFPAYLETSVVVLLNGVSGGLKWGVR